MTLLHVLSALAVVACLVLILPLAARLPVVGPRLAACEPLWLLHSAAYLWGFLDVQEGQEYHEGRWRLAFWRVQQERARAMYERGFLAGVAQAATEHGRRDRMDKIASGLRDPGERRTRGGIILGR